MGTSDLFFYFLVNSNYIEGVFDKNYKSIIKYLNASYFNRCLQNPISELIIYIFLKENFNENCYMSCALLLSKSSIYDQFKANFNLFNFEIFLRYFLIILIGFGPLFIIIKFFKN